MINAESCFINCINSPVRKVLGRVELYEGSTLLQTFKTTDALKSFTVERVGESKFFGFGICQKLNVKLRDVNREINITTANTLEAVFGTGCDYIYTFPAFYVSETHRDENTNELSITAYDAIGKATKYNYADLGIEYPYTIERLATACASQLGLPLNITVDDDVFQTNYPQGANFDGAETIREVLNAIADATQTIYYVDNEWRLTFKRLDRDGEPVATIDKSKYFTLNSKTNRRIGAVCHATELGDNVIATADASGTTAYVRDNAFWEMRDDIATLVESALEKVKGFTINQFDCSWRGNYLLEIGDKIGLITKDDKEVYSYLLDDTITFDGGMSEQTQWSYTNNEDETATNPTSLGDALKQTYAKVDKANKEITLVASDVSANSEKISGIEMNTESISASVSKIEEQTNSALEGVNSEIATLSSKVEATMSANDIRLEIESALATGTDKVITSTGFTFNEEGLTVSKSDSEMETKITEDGMRVYKDKQEVLTADNEGVKAEDLHATTYLIIGVNSRFEDYNDGARTGCFWIGG